MRPWEEIIPAEDRYIYEKSGLSRPQPFGERPALLIVDALVGLVGDRPMDILEAMEEYPLSCGMSGWNSIPHIKQLLDAARKSNIPRVFIKADPASKLFVGDSAKGFSNVEILSGHHVTEFPDLIAPNPDEFLVRKTKQSAFFGTPLATYLHMKGIDTLLMCGGTTSGCLRVTVADAYAHGFRVFVVEECTFDRSQFSHLVSLYEMNTKVADVITLQQAIAHLQARSHVSQAK